jgi:hypothetical protein
MGQTLTTILSYVWSTDQPHDPSHLIDLFNIRDGISANRAFQDDSHATIEILRYFRQKRMLKEYRTCVEGILDLNNYKDITPLSGLFRLCFNPRNDKDLLLLFGTPWENVMIEIYCTRLKMDDLTLRSSSDRHHSMAAKYAPTEKGHYDKRYDAVNKFCKVLGGMKPWSKSKYRRFIARLRAGLDLVETKMSEGRWKEIKAKDVPFLARKRYKKAFKRHGVSRKVKFKRTELRQLGVIKKLDPYTSGHKNVQYDISGCGRFFMFRLGKFFEDYLKSRNINDLVFIFGGDNLYERFTKESSDDDPLDPYEPRYGAGAGGVHKVYWYPGETDKIRFISDGERNHYIEGVDNTLIDYFLSLKGSDVSNVGYIRHIVSNTLTKPRIYG